MIPLGGPESSVSSVQQESQCVHTPRRKTSGRHGQASRRRPCAHRSVAMEASHQLSQEQAVRPQPWLPRTGDLKALGEKPLSTLPLLSISFLRLHLSYSCLADHSLLPCGYSLSLG